MSAPSGAFILTPLLTTKSIAAFNRLLAAFLSTASFETRALLTTIKKVTDFPLRPAVYLGKSGGKGLGPRVDSKWEGMAVRSKNGVDVAVAPRFLAKGSEMKRSKPEKETWCCQSLLCNDEMRPTARVFVVRGGIREEYTTSEASSGDEWEIA